MASCGLCKKSQREQLVALSNSGEYLVSQSFMRLLLYGGGFTNICVREQCSWTCPMTFTGRGFPLCQHKRLCTLRVSHLEKNPGKPYFGCKERLPFTFFCWADWGLHLLCAPPPQRISEKKTMHAPINVMPEGKDHVHGIGWGL